VHWRGATQTAYDGERWISGGLVRLDDDMWRSTGGRGLVRGSGPIGSVLDVELADVTAGRMFAPSSVRRISVTSEHPDDGPEPMWDGTVRFLDGRGRANWTATYRL